MRKQPIPPFFPFAMTCIAIMIGISHANAEMFVSGYLGKASTLNSDVELNRSGGTNLTFDDVSWDDDSFSGPLYYGYRVGYQLRKDRSGFARRRNLENRSLDPSLHCGDYIQLLSLSSVGSRRDFVIHWR